MIRPGAMHLPGPIAVANSRGGGPPGLAVDIRQEAGTTVIVVSGRVTVDSSPHLRAVLHDAIDSGTGVTIDFGAAPYLDTSAVATLLEAATLASKRHVALRVIGLRGDARIVAETTELDRIFQALGFEVQVA